MKYTIVDSSGEIVRFLESTADVVALNTPEGCVAIPGHPPFKIGRYSGGIWIERPQRPSPELTWDSQANSWVDARPLTQVKTDKLAALKKQRSLVEHSGFTWDGSVFDSDPTAQLRIQGAVSFSQLSPTFEIDWSLRDNSIRTLDAEDMTNVGIAMSQHIIATHNTYRSLKNDVNSATTRDVVNAISWPT